jgi:hypothetical protein
MATEDQLRKMWFEPEWQKLQAPDGVENGIVVVLPLAESRNEA